MIIKRCYIFTLILLLAGILSLSASAADIEVKTYKATVENGIQRVDITGGDYYFDPNHIIVRVNVPVEFYVKKAPGLVPHDIIMDAPEAGIVFKEKLKSETQVIRFTPKRTGIFPLYCGKKLLFLKSHREKGMEGILEVTE